jgi:hypothetical protein
MKVERQLQNYQSNFSRLADRVVEQHHGMYYLTLSHSLSTLSLTMTDTTLIYRVINRGIGSRQTKDSSWYHTID